MRLLAFLLLLPVFIGCATTPPPPGPPPGRIHIAYAPTKTDAAAGGELRVNIYRAERAEGPFARLNAKPIAIAADPARGSLRVWTDDTVPAGAVRYYYLTAVDAKGMERKIVPVSAAQAVLFAPERETKSSTVNSP